MNFPFQADIGSHTSILMLESLVGLSVAATRQKAARELVSAASALGPPVGSLDSPAGTPGGLPAGGRPRRLRQLELPGTHALGRGDRRVRQSERGQALAGNDGRRFLAEGIHARQQHPQACHRHGPAGLPPQNPPGGRTA